MIAAFSTALQAALTTFVTGVTTAVGDNLSIILPVTLGIVGLGLVWRVAKRFAGGR